MNQEQPLPHTSLTSGKQLKVVGTAVRTIARLQNDQVSRIISEVIYIIIDVRLINTVS